MFKLIVLLLATVAYASADGLYSGYGGLYGYGGYGYGGYGGYGLGHGVASISPYVHAPVATSYANTYKVAVAPPITKYIAPAVTKVAYAAPITKVAYAPTYSAPSVSYGHYGYTIPPSVTYLHSGLGYGGYGHGYGGGYGLGNYGYGLGYGHGYGYGGYYH
ncbi:PREDICTED: cuticle protein 64-like [Trachymyrmex septentrionalis]|uniref:cuticle protein 64-like n=1 Tax=Trachymyrmex septentrionalis TaxID=34720 RepID=UPI00084EEB78|nr:PREDICTED: cuticle protein 64-like [Trachymyrmex septentrionalis]